MSAAIDHDTRAFAGGSNGTNCAGHYPAEIKVSDEELSAVHLARSRFHGDWNYRHALASADLQKPKPAADIDGWRRKPKSISAP